MISGRAGTVLAVVLLAGGCTRWSPNRSHFQARASGNVMSSSDADAPGEKSLLLSKPLSEYTAAEFYALTRNYGWNGHERKRKCHDDKKCKGKNKAKMVIEEVQGGHKLGFTTLKSGEEALVGRLENTGKDEADFKPCDKNKPDLVDPDQRELAATDADAWFACAEGCCGSSFPPFSQQNAR